MVMKTLSEDPIKKEETIGRNIALRPKRRLWKGGLACAALA